jgi:hypothetical protein
MGSYGLFDNTRTRRFAIQDCNCTGLKKIPGVYSKIMYIRHFSIGYVGDHMKKTNLTWLVLEAVVLMTIAVVIWFLF